MPAVFVNTATVLAGSLLGILFRNRLRESMQRALIIALALCTVVIGVMSAVETNDILCVILCMALGTLIGELLKIDSGIEKAGDLVRKRFARAGGSSARFTEGFTSASILFCIGSMTIMGSIEAGIHQDYSIIFTKSALDFVSSMALGAALGLGVTFSAAFVFVFQGALTLLAARIGPALSEEIVTELSAVGGTILIGMGVNMLELPRERIRVANMLPAIFLPIAYFPLKELLLRLFS